MGAYFDNAATTRCSDGAKARIIQALSEDYGNPSSLHTKGMEGENQIRKAREQICRTLKCKESELIFTSGGTESNNLAILGATMANRRRGMHLITTEVEHPAVSVPMKFLEEQGFTVTRLKVDRDGLISPEELEQAIRPETILVSVMYVNNEIGAVEPVEEAARVIHRKNPETLFHVDAIQAYGKYLIYPGRQGIDLMSVSGHKIHGPKGVGFLYVREKTRIKPVIYGGGQQKNMRSGTENVPGIAGLGQAAQEACEMLSEKQESAEREISGRTGGTGVGPCERKNRTGQRPSYYQSQRGRCAQRGASSWTGRKRDLCICRKCLRIQQTSPQRYPAGHSRKTGIPGFYHTNQFQQREYNKRGGRMPGCFKESGSHAPEIHQTLENRDGRNTCLKHF